MNKFRISIKYSIDIKHDKIESWNKYLRQEEAALAKAEKHLNEDLVLFDEFLDKCYHNANEVTLQYKQKKQPFE